MPSRSRKRPPQRDEQRKQEIHSSKDRKPARLHQRHRLPGACPCRKSNPNILVVVARRELGDKECFRLIRRRARPARPFSKDRWRAHLHYNISGKTAAHVGRCRSPNTTNVVKAFPSDRTDQPFGTSILPRGAWRRWSVANAHRSKSSDEGHCHRPDRGSRIRIVGEPVPSRKLP